MGPNCEFSRRVEVQNVKFIDFDHGIQGGIGDPVGGLDARFCVLRNNNVGADRINIVSAIGQTRTSQPSTSKGATSPFFAGDLGDATNVTIDDRPVGHHLADRIRRRPRRYLRVGAVVHGWCADIDKMHRARGFKEIGYHFFIRKDGTVAAGRDLTAASRWAPIARARTIAPSASATRAGFASPR